MILLKSSKFWIAERDKHQGRPFILFKMEDATFFGLKALHVYRTDKHWNWVYWDIAGHDHRPPSGLGFATPERAALHVVRHLVREAAIMTERVEKLLRNHE